jgi:hypothetical protein
MSFQWRLLQRRPSLDVEIARVDHSAWKLFAPFHYLTGDCTAAPRATCFSSAVRRVVPRRPPPAASRGDEHQGRLAGVTLPDYQGLGLAMILADTLGAAHRGIGNRLHTYPAHPSLIRSFDRSPKWSMHKKPGVFGSRISHTSTLAKRTKMGSRPNAVFEYCGEKMGADEARALIEGQKAAV